MLHAHQPFLRRVGLYDSQSHQALSPQTSRQAKYAVLVLDWRIRHHVRLLLVFFPEHQADKQCMPSVSRRGTPAHAI
jgi:hypothetical protein